MIQNLNLWQLCLALKDFLSDTTCRFEFISIGRGEMGFRFDPNERLKEEVFAIFFGHSLSGHTTVSAQRPFEVDLSGLVLPAHEKRILSLYLPYALLPYWAKKERRCFSITHFAQTLDGRIASVSGDSKWIGNEENLIHAHKMRALCDTILVGSNTLNIDNPRLSVRLVEGNDPIKVVLGGEDLVLSEYHAMVDGTILFCQNHYESPHDIEKIRLPQKQDVYPAQDVLEELYSRGHLSVYIEGGSFTSSCFLQARAVDQVQIHITPKILGSGTSGFSFDGINSVNEAIEFQNGRFEQMGGHMMFVGQPV